MTDSPKAVFLSYASQDAEAAQLICDALRTAGIEVWFDLSELRGGDAWDQKIRKQIHDCSLFVPIISANTASRHEGYFRLEWDLADQRTHMIARDRAFIVPVCVDTTPEKGTDVPETFLRVQWTRLPAGETPTAFCQRMEALLAGPETRSAAPVGSEPLMSAVRRPRFDLWLAAGAVGLVLVGAIVWQPWRLMTPKPAAVAGPSNVGEGAPSAVPEKSIAVLPFVDMSEKKDQEYFADGMAEEIIDLLAHVPELRVIARTSSFQFKGKNEDLRTIGARLGAAFVVEGSIRRVGSRMRVTAQLIDTRDGTHRWSGTYDRDVIDVLKVQGEIAAGLVRELQVEVMPTMDYRTLGTLKNGAVYDAYLRGQHGLNRFDQQGFEEAVADFRGALEVDPSFAPAADGLSLALANLADWGFVPSAGWESARGSASAALRINANSALAHTILASVYAFYDWDWQQSRREFGTAIALMPSSSTVLVRAARQRLAVGDTNEALRYVEMARAGDPLDPTVHLVRCWTYMRLGRLDEAERAARRILEISPSFVSGHYWVGIVLLMEGKPAEALAEIQKEGSLAGGQSQGLALAYFTLHRTKEADAALERVKVEADYGAYQVAQAYAYRGENDRAFDWLGKAYDQKDAFLWIIKADPLIRNLGGDPRYKAFLRKMNLSE